MVLGQTSDGQTSDGTNVGWDKRRTDKRRTKTNVGPRQTSDQDKHQTGQTSDQDKRRTRQTSDPDKRRTGTNVGLIKKKCKIFRSKIFFQDKNHTNKNYIILCNMHVKQYLFIFSHISIHVYYNRMIK